MKYKSKELLEQFNSNSKKIKYLDNLNERESFKLKVYFEWIATLLSILSEKELNHINLFISGLDSKRIAIQLQRSESQTNKILRDSFKKMDRILEI